MKSFKIVVEGSVRARPKQVAITAGREEVFQNITCLSEGIWQLCMFVPKRNPYLHQSQRHLHDC